MANALVMRPPQVGWESLGRHCYPSELWRHSAAPRCVMWGCSIFDCVICFTDSSSKTLIVDDSKVGVQIDGGGWFNGRLDVKRGGFLGILKNHKQLPPKNKRKMDPLKTPPSWCLTSPEPRCNNDDSLLHSKFGLQHTPWWMLYFLHLM